MNYKQLSVRFCSFALCAIKNMTAVVKGRQLALAAIVATFSVVAVAAVLTPSLNIWHADVFASKFCRSNQCYIHG